MIKLDRKTKKVIIYILSMWMFGELVFWPIVNEIVEEREKEAEKRVEDIAKELDKIILKQRNVEVSINFNPLARKSIEIQKEIENINIEYELKEKEVFSIVAGRYLIKDIGKIKIHHMPRFVSNIFVRFEIPVFSRPYEYTIKITTQNIITLVPDTREYIKIPILSRRDYNDLIQPKILENDKDAYIVPIKLLLDPNAICSLKNPINVLGYIDIGTVWQGIEYSRKQPFVVKIYPPRYAPLFLDDELDYKIYAAYVDPDSVKWYSSQILHMASVNGANKLEVARVLFYALKAAGIIYSYSPNSPFSLVNRYQTTPETLHYLSGQCSDLSILFASLYMANSIETYFVFVPHHVFILFNPENIPEALKNYTINYMDKKLIPLETTYVDKTNFLEAIQSAYITYNKFSKRTIINISIAQWYYPPLHCGEVKINLPQKDNLIKQIKSNNDFQEEI